MSSDGKRRYKFLYDWDQSFEEFWRCLPRYQQKLYVKVPCGRCSGCRMDYAKSWSNRLMMENIYHDSSWFITLTYDNDNCPMSDDLMHYTLRKCDWQLFMKRLRESQDKLYGRKLRFLACGEYGGNTFRPHYHAIIFGLQLEDLVKCGVSGSGFTLFKSDYLASIWKNGMVEVGVVTSGSCAYVARYVVKKNSQGSNEDYAAFGIEPEFILMSRKPGLGYQYFMDHYDKIYDSDKIYLKSDLGGSVIRPPRAFDKLMNDIDPFLLDNVKQQRLINANDAHVLSEMKSELSYRDQLAVKERIFESKTKIMKGRDFI